MPKKILLVEPAYKTKYPPLGLMKLAAYHRIKGDEVVFVRGKNPEIRNREWDRIYISSLFTYTWKETVSTINYYKDYYGPNSSISRNLGKIYVGGILATLMKKDLEDATGVVVIAGLLKDENKITINPDDNIIIDNLTPDYSILKQVEIGLFKYEHTDAYLGYSTRGCVRKCGFCAVRTLEPEYVSYLDIKKMTKLIAGSEGEEKAHLILMDNNVLASKDFDRIIDDIVKAGFGKGATFGPGKGKKRRVDFNQGLDARLLTEEKMKKLAEINLDPMRLAFDDVAQKETYIKAIRLAHKYGQSNMSNYILYNYKTDTLEDFYERLKINIDLNEDFKASSVRTVVYSFPMRYIPLTAKDRAINTGNPYWNRRYLRGIKLILNVTKGPVMPGPDFFYQAFGLNAAELRKILLMPDEFIRLRLVANWRKITDHFERMQPYVRQWYAAYDSTDEATLVQLTHILSDEDINKASAEYGTTKNKKLKKLLEFHIDADLLVSNHAKTT